MTFRRAHTLFARMTGEEHLGASFRYQVEALSTDFEIDFDDDASYLDTIERARAELINVSTDFIDQLVAQQRQIDTLRRHGAVSPQTAAGVVAARMAIAL